MRQLLPRVDDVEPLTAYLAAERPTPDHRPWLTVGMITSLDGAAAVDGRSGGLGGPADQEVLRAVRGLADVLVVGAGTVRAEDYGPVRYRSSVEEARVAVGCSPGPPRLAIVTGSADLDPAAPALADAPVRPLVFTTDEAPADRVDALAEVADVHRCGTGAVDVVAALRVLRELGAEVAVCEGGPTLNGAMVAADVVDEWCLTLSPTIAGGDAGRIVNGAPGQVRDQRLVSLLEADGLLFGRWLRIRDDG